MLRPTRARAVLAAVGAALTLVLGPTGAPTAVAATDRAASDDAAADAGRGHAVVVIGTAGLRWDDVHTLSTPALWDVSRTASIGTLAARSVRSSACPADGWLALSAGARAADLPGTAYGECRTLVNPSPEGQVRGWADYVESAELEDYDPRLGLLGDTLAAAGTPAAAIGPGAAIALADGDGTLSVPYTPRPSDPAQLRTDVRTALGTADLVVVDVGAVRDTGRATAPRAEPLAQPTAGTDDETGAGDGEGADEPAPTGEEPDGPDVITEPTRPEQVRPVDERVGAVLAGIRASDRDVTVLLVSLADSGTRARMQLAAAIGPAPGGQTYGDSLLGSRSTRQPGMIQATDLTPTVLAALGITDDAPAGALVGAPVVPVPGPDSANARLTAVLDIDQHSVAVRPVTPRFYTLLIVSNLVLYLLVTLGLNTRALGALSRAAARLPGRAAARVVSAVGTRPRVVLQGLRMAGIAVGSLPVASILANLVPWWRAPSSGWALTGVIAAWIAVVSALALLPRWRRPILAPAGVVAGATALVIAVDVVFGAPLQVSAPMGVQPVVAGRFYGFNNTAFSLFAAATLLSAVVLADPLVRAGRRRLAALVVAVIGITATVLDGMPGLGSDFGGPPALVPGFAVLALLAAGVRLSWWRLVGVLGAGVLVVTGFAVVDWLRPADDRTHLGRFVDTVLDGGLGGVVARKLAQNLANLGGTWLTVLALAGIALVVLVLVRPLRGAATAPDGGVFAWLTAGEPLSTLGTEAPMLRPGLIALGVTLGIGFAVNDSGIVIPAIGVSLAVPLLISICAGWLLQVGAGRAPRDPEDAPVAPEHSLEA
ncbi:hypothetical protein [Actinotalea sp. JY-7876]|uniref:hypothetical protein n=1 Tax=Actinotalea sp. JY-7876 TaxID=2758442 RepID=UPI0015F6A5A0|nr:hypothetical protein [Actinotalea sp. JY-7876]